MRIVASAAISADGYLDDGSPERLVLSNPSDWEEVHALRAACDAIMVGAETIRKDNPALVIRSEELRAQRESLGMSPDLVKVTVSGSCDIDPDSRFFTEGGEGVRKIVFTGTNAAPDKVARLESVAKVIKLSEVNARRICEELEKEDIRVLMVEGGAKVLRMFLSEKMVDAIRIAHSRTIVVDDPSAPRMPWYGDYPFEAEAICKDMRTLRDMDITYYILKYQLSAQTEEMARSLKETIENSDLSGNEMIYRRIKMISEFTTDVALLMRAIDISENCPPSKTAFSVGCIVKTRGGEMFAGYSRETSPLNHAEEEAIIKAHVAGADLEGATLYSSMEPCSTRASKPVSCSEIIIREKIGRVVYAYREPDHFVRCEGTAMLRRADIEVCVMPLFAPRVILVNAHLLMRGEK